MLSPVRAAFALLFCLLTAPAFAAAPVHGIAMHGAPKYGAGFTHFDYVNPDAPKGGELRLAEVGTFDSLNPYVLKGMAAPDLGYVYQTLMASSGDEAFSAYGLIAQSIETPPDRSWAVFNLRPEARWQDGKPITANDVAWTFRTLLAHGHPSYRIYYAGVKDVTVEGERRVKFTFKNGGDNRELPLILGQLPVLPEHAFKGKDFESVTAEMPVGSGPYRVKSVDFGKRITYERVKDWWAKDLPVTKGLYNFDTITVDMYRDPTVLLQAFFAGNFDVRSENISRAWFTAYDDKPPVIKGLIKKEQIQHELPSGMQAYVYNTRRPVFADPHVREALAYAFDFEWSNKSVAHGAYKRSYSYFTNSELASSGIPEGAELKLLEPFRDQLPPELFTTPFTVPKTDGSGKGVRQNLVIARDKLAAAGWKLNKAGLLEKDGLPLTFEILVDQDAFAPWISPMIANLKKLGVTAALRVVDTAQYQKRLDDFDFDMLVSTFPQSLSPGNEQRDFWGSDRADMRGSRNLAGVKSPVVDKLIGNVVAAQSREQLITAVHALDRVLLWGYYVIPQWYLDAARIAYWDKFGRPATTAKYAPVLLDSWWSKQPQEPSR